MIQRVTVPAIKDWGRHNCHVVRAGQHIWISGVVGMTSDGQVPDDTAAQFDVAIDIVDECLKAVNAGSEHVVRVQVFMTDITERPLINPRRIDYFGENRPASTLIQVSALVDPRLKVEIECQAFVP